MRNHMKSVWSFLNFWEFGVILVLIFLKPRHLPSLPVWPAVRRWHSWIWRRCEWLRRPCKFQVHLHVLENPWKRKGLFDRHSYHTQSFLKISLHSKASPARTNRGRMLFLSFFAVFHIFLKRVWGCAGYDICYDLSRTWVLQGYRLPFEKPLGKDPSAVRYPMQCQTKQVEHSMCATDATGQEMSVIPRFIRVVTCRFMVRSWQQKCLPYADNVTCKQWICILKRVLSKVHCATEDDTSARSGICQG